MQDNLNRNLVAVVVNHDRQRLGTARTQLKRSQREHRDSQFQGRQFTPRIDSINLFRWRCSGSSSVITGTAGSSACRPTDLRVREAWDTAEVRLD